MKRLGAAAMILAGVALLGLGLLFLVGAAGQGSRYAVAGAGMLLGALALGGGLRLKGQVDASSPARVEAAVLALAKREDGELSEDELKGALGARWPVAEGVLTALLARGSARRRLDEGRLFYVFPDLQARLAVRRCGYCDAEVPLSSEATRCPSCGGTIETGVARVGLTDGGYSMDG